MFNNKLNTKKGNKRTKIEIKKHNSTTCISWLEAMNNEEL